MYTVEYSVKVWFIGKVHDDSEWQLRRDYNEIHHPLEIKWVRPPDTPDNAYEPINHSNSEYEAASYGALSTSSLTAASYPIPDESSSQQTENMSLYDGVPMMDSRREDDLETQTTEVEFEVWDGLKSRDQQYDSQCTSETEPNQVNTALGKTADKILSRSPNFGYFTSDDLMPFHAKSTNGEESECSWFPDSVRSDGPSRDSSTTSLSFGVEPFIQDQLANVIRADAELRTVCDQAINKSTWGRFESNLRRCLVQLSKDIRIEIQSRQATQAARAIRTFARSTAQSMKRALERQEITKETSQGTDEMYDSNSEGSDIGMDPIDDVEEHMGEFKQFALLIVSSQSFEWFKERFELCVNPNPARFAVFQQWPTLSSKSSQLLLAYDIEWDLESFVDIHVKEYTQLGNLVTLTGEVVNAEALSSREYLSWAWPDIGTLLLEGVELLLLHKSSCKAPCKFS
jgi:hypothetical protein